MPAHEQTTPTDKDEPAPRELRGAVLALADILRGVAPVNPVIHGKLREIYSLMGVPF
jgi:hypothetical protein